MDFWEKIVSKYHPENILEIGCNVGGNLSLVDISPEQIFGLDINKGALEILRTNYPQINAVYGTLFDNPFKDNFFDLVFTCGVLIHVRPDNLYKAMEEVVRTAKHYVLAMEYYADYLHEIPYRKAPHALFKGPYGRIYQRDFGLDLLETGLLGTSEGFDNVVYWILRK